MPNITICTPLRDAAGELPNYQARFYGLDWPGSDLRLVLCEGDSADNTWPLVKAWTEHSPMVQAVKCDTGRPRYPSVIDDDRFRTLATVFNAALGAVDLAWTDYVLMLPVDIVYGHDLLRRLVRWELPILAPLVFMAGRFYDTWAFVRDGRGLGDFPMELAPQLFGDTPVEMTTVGGTALIRADVLRAGCRYSKIDVDQGLCFAARQAGFDVWADPTTYVFHPPRG